MNWFSYQYSSMARCLNDTRKECRSLGQESHWKFACTLPALKRAVLITSTISQDILLELRCILSCDLSTTLHHLFLGLGSAKNPASPSVYPDGSNRPFRCTSDAYRSGRLTLLALLVQSLYTLLSVSIIAHGVRRGDNDPSL